MRKIRDLGMTDMRYDGRSAVADQMLQDGTIPEYTSRLDAMTLEETETTGSSLGKRIIGSWADMRGHTRGLIEENLSEHRLLFYVLLSDVIFFVSFSIRTLVSPTGFQPTQIGLATAQILIFALLVRTALMYALSLALQAASRGFGGQGTWRDTRNGVFWGALVAAPFDILLALIGGWTSFQADAMPLLGSPIVTIIVLWGGFVPFFWFISQGLAEAHRFRTNLFAFAALLGLGAAAILFGSLFGFAGHP